MLDVIAYLDAQRRTGELAREALPDSPTVAPAPPSSRGTTLRHQISAVLRRLADALEPTANRRTAAPVAAKPLEVIVRHHRDTRRR